MELTIIVSIFLFIFGLIGVIKGEFNITRQRRVHSNTGRLMGIIMLGGAVTPFCMAGWSAFFAQWGSLALAIVIGLVSSEKIETLKSPAAETGRFWTCPECLGKNPEDATSCVHCGHHNLAAPLLGTKSVDRSKAEPSPKEVMSVPDEQDDLDAKPLQGEVPNKLQQAITLIKSGDKQSGGSLLAEILKAEPRNETAWLWMSSIVANDEQRHYCLKQVLTINPNNQLAKKGLVKLQHKQGS